MSTRFRTAFMLVALALAGALLLPGAFAARAQEAASARYNLGVVTIEQPNYPADSRFRQMPVTLQGVVAVPEGDGPFPVAVVIHGCYPFCNAMANDTGDADVYPCPPENDLHQYAGFTELAEALAARGYLTIVPDLSSEFNNGYGIADIGVRSRQIIQATLDELEAGADSRLGVAGKADLSRLVAVTHSRGGPLAERILSGAVGPAIPFRALVMLTPMTPFVTDPALDENLPVALVVAACDGDVGVDEPRAFLPLLPNTRPAPVLFTTLPGATHNAFSTQLGPDPRQPCEADQTLDTQAQRDFTARFVPDFFDTALAYQSMVDGR